MTWLAITKVVHLQGLEHVAFSMMQQCPTVSLVSEGAEAVLISRKFFIQHLSDDMRKKLRTTVSSFAIENKVMYTCYIFYNFQHILKKSNP